MERDLIPLDADDENQFGLGWDIEVPFLFGEAFQTNLFAFGILVFLDVCLRTLENYFTLRLCSLTVRTVQKNVYGKV